MSDMRIRPGHNLGPLLALGLFLTSCLVYNFYHPRRFSGQILVQNANESLVMVMVAMAQVLPGLVSGLDLSAGAVMTMVITLANHMPVGSPRQILRAHERRLRAGRDSRLRRCRRRAMAAADRLGPGAGHLTRFDRAFDLAALSPMGDVYLIPAITAVVIYGTNILGGQDP